MFIKVQFSANTRYNTTLRVLTAIFQNSNITSASTLQSQSGSWSVDLKGNIEFDKCQIIRTDTASNVKMRYMKSNTNAVYQHFWMTEFDVYDNPGQKWYLESRNNGAGATDTYFGVGTDISGSTGTMSEPSLAVNLADSYATASLTRARLATSADNSISTINNPPSSENIRTMWAYVTNECIVLAYTMATSTNTGMTTTFNSTNFAGPYIFGHYERWDYWNKPSNGIVPVMYTNIWRATSQGLNTEFLGVLNSEYSTKNNATGNFRIFNTINAAPSTNTSWPLQRFPIVNTGVGLRHNNIVALNGASNPGNAAATGTYYSALYNTGGFTRYISEDLKSTTFAMLPITWGNSYYQNMGGSFSARTQVYLYNGDYFPGDEFIFNDKTYMIWPLNNGYTNRLGLAIPKE
jgi:hypothetical protein